ncbi:GntR family transcriptional regulator [Amycolatopsis pithecellobii]|uniref:FCD domain-containing protein n=1 Tax=Amycolatopsis pithecellobii TaxID=664692 RepID=A0A6N7YXV4_9PSEU|nr:GntR family transcriptional regulator [Amycolatopsis pithecellobii]MTD53723.1 FCD domain-containing protein [Amycolatopsis pithecellobii]
MAAQPYDSGTELGEGDYTNAPENTGDNLTQAAYYRIRAMILDGELAIGGQVSVVGLATLFGMSRSPVRSAVERLISERLVRKTAGGAAVAAPSRHDLLDALIVRAPLEGLAARLAAPHVDDIALQRLTDIHGRFSAAVDAGDPAMARRADLEFHQTIQNLSANACLVDSLERVQTQVILAAYSTAWNSSKRPAALEHARILDALTQQDAETAEHVAVRHIQNLTSRVLDEWKRSDAL